MERWYVEVIADDGTANPALGLHPAPVLYRSKALADRTAPTVVEIGKGWYGFEPTGPDEGAGVAYVFDNGEGFEPRYAFGGVYDDDHPFDVLVFTDGGDALWSGSGATLATYADESGDRTPPALLQVASAYCYVLEPSAADVASLTHYQVNAAAGALPPSYTGFFDPEGTGGSGDTTPPVVVLISPPQGIVTDPATPMIVEVTDDHALGPVDITVSLPGNDESVFAAGKFGQRYTSSTIVPIDNGFRFRCLRTGGWPTGRIAVTVEAVDLAGNQA